MQIFKWMPLKADDAQQNVTQSTASMTATESNVQRQSNNSINNNNDKEREISSAKNTTAKVLSEQQVVNKSTTNLSTYSPSKMGDHNSNYANDTEILNSTKDAMSASPIVSGDESTGRKSCMDRADHADLDYNHSRMSRSGASSVSGISSAGDQPTSTDDNHQMQTDAEKHESRFEEGAYESKKRTIDLDDSHVSLSPPPAPKRTKTDEVAMTDSMDVLPGNVPSSAPADLNKSLSNQLPPSITTTHTPTDEQVLTSAPTKTLPHGAGTPADVRMMDADDPQCIARQVTDHLISAVSSRDPTE